MTITIVPDESCPLSPDPPPVGLVTGCRTCGRVMWAGSFADCPTCRDKPCKEPLPKVLYGEVTPVTVPEEAKK